MLDLVALTSVDDLMALIAEHGDAIYFLGFGFAFARTGFLPPILAGYAAHKGALDPATTFLVFAAGSWLGCELRFFIGRRWGHALLAKVPALQPTMQVVLRVLDRYPSLFIATYRFARGLRSVSAIALGMTGVSRLRFMPLNFLGAFLWAAAFTGAGYALGRVSEAVLGQAANGVTIGLLVVFLLAGWLISRRLPAPR